MTRLWSAFGANDLDDFKAFKEAKAQRFRDHDSAIADQQATINWASNTISAGPTTVYDELHLQPWGANVLVVSMHLNASASDVDAEVTITVGSKVQIFTFLGVGAAGGWTHNNMIGIGASGLAQSGVLVQVKVEIEDIGGTGDVVNFADRGQSQWRAEET